MSKQATVISIKTHEETIRIFQREVRNLESKLEAERQHRENVEEVFSGICTHIAKKALPIDDYRSEPAPKTFGQAVTTIDRIIRHSEKLAEQHFEKAHAAEKEFAEFRANLSKGVAGFIDAAFMPSRDDT